MKIHFIVLMIRINSKEIIGIFKDNTPFTAVYKGTRLVWQAISSCFGGGYWVNEKRWKNEDAWKN